MWTAPRQHKFAWGSYNGGKWITNQYGWIGFYTTEHSVRRSRRLQEGDWVLGWFRILIWRIMPTNEEY